MMQVDDIVTAGPPADAVVEEEDLLDSPTEDILLHMGPQHPSTHGVLRVTMKLKGERILDAKPYPGYLHRGTEKLAENRFYNQIVPLTDRLDYASAFNNNLAYCQTVEKLLGIEVPERALYLRVMFSELQRIASHLLWLGTHAMDIGALSVFLYCMRDRELILDLFEAAAGARLTLSYAQVGGLRADIPAGFETSARNFANILPSRIKEYTDLLSANPIWIQRTRGIGTISAADAVAYSLTGACLRGSGVNYDVRKVSPYAVYDRLEFDVPLGEKGDIYDRYIVRLEEMRQSLRLIHQVLDKLPSGPVKADEPLYVLPEKEDVMTSAEAMQRHFSLIIHGFNPPVGEVYSSVESPKGELGFYIVSDGSPKPYRLKVRAPSYINLQSLPVMSSGHLVADVVGIIGSIDIILGEVDR